MKKRNLIMIGLLVISLPVLTSCVKTAGQNIGGYYPACGIFNQDDCHRIAQNVRPKQAVWIENDIASRKAALLKKASIQERAKYEQTLISKIEKTCEAFGFKKGTLDYANCMKEIYLKEATPAATDDVKEDAATEAQLLVLRQQLELQRQQAAALKAAENRRQGQALMDLGNSLLNPSPPPSNRPLTCRTMSNGITTCQ